MREAPLKTKFDENVYSVTFEEELEACIEIKTLSFAWGFVLIITADCSDIFLSHLCASLPGEICHLGYADDTTLMAESEEELKSLLMKVKE